MLYFLGMSYARLAFFKSIYLRASLAFVLALLIALVTGSPFIRFMKKKQFGEKIREEGPKSHFAKANTPSMGGVFLIGSLLLTTILVADLRNPFILLLLLSTLVFTGIGFLDDYTKVTKSKKGLAGRKKILGQGLVALVIWSYVYVQGLTGSARMDFSIVNPMNSHQTLYVGGILMLFLMLFVIVGTSNAVNLTDGLDGLVILPSIICAAIFAVIAYFTGHITLSDHLNLFYTKGAGELGVFLSALCGAGFGFLWYNCSPAQVFMGDTGSLAIGGIFGVVAILLKQEFLLPVMGGIFVIEALSVIIQVTYYRRTGGKRIFLMSPIHHHFEELGWPETKVTGRFWIVSILFGILALAMIRLRGI